MSIIRMFLLWTILASINYAQFAQFMPENKPILVNNLSEEHTIKTVVNNFFTAVKAGNYGLIKNYLSQAVLNDSLMNITINDSKKGTNPEIVLNYFQIDSLQMLISGNYATVSFIFSDWHNYKNQKEVLSLTKNNGRWIITGSNSIVKIILSQEKTNKVLKSETRVTNISSELINNSLSNTAIIQRTAWYTNVLTINRTVTKQDPNVHNNLFGMPGDGKVVELAGSEKLFTVVGDNTWHRIIFAKYNSFGSWVKSYGDNPMEQDLGVPIRISLDKFGNIFVLSKSNRKIYKLKYNDETESISYITALNIPQMLTPVDFCVDDHNTPDDITDDLLWVVDELKNNVYKLDCNGITLGKYTYVANTDGEQLRFVRPNRILLYNNSGTKGLALIDDYDDRVVFVPFITGFQSEGIIGEYQAFRFKNSTNTTLNSFGVTAVGDGLYVGDYENGLFHVFQPNNLCYVGSIKTNSSNQNQWVHPNIFSSTAMSNSNRQYLGFMTMDIWNNNTGINTYFTGADMVNPVITYRLDTAYYDISIETSFIGYSKVTTELYSQDRQLVKSYGTDETIAACRTRTIVHQNEVNPVGKYFFRYTITPACNDKYPAQYQQAPIYKEVWFAMPLKCSLAGPSQGAESTLMKWTTVRESGSGDFSYIWTKQDYGSPIIQTLESIEPELVLMMPNNSFTLTCQITDNFTKQKIFITKFVSKVTYSDTLISE